MSILQCVALGQGGAHYSALVSNELTRKGGLEGFSASG
jgi:hypothetical protein